jgi:hypothetical protein
MRLIDADALAKFPIRVNHYDKVNGNEHFVLGIESVLEYAEYLPTIDAVPVVRCKDCVGYREEDGVCVAWEGFVRTDDFCSNCGADMRKGENG